MLILTFNLEAFNLQWQLQRTCLHDVSKHWSCLQRGFTWTTFTLFLPRHLHFIPCESLLSFKYRCSLFYVYYKINICIICVLFVIWVKIVCTNGFCLPSSFHSHCPIDDFVNENIQIKILFGLLFTSSVHECIYYVCVCVHVCVVGLIQVLVIWGQNSMKFENIKNRWV